MQDTEPVDQAAPSALPLRHWVVAGLVLAVTLAATGLLSTLLRASVAEDQAARFRAETDEITDEATRAIERASHVVTGLRDGVMVSGFDRAEFHELAELAIADGRTEAFGGVGLVRALPARPVWTGREWSVTDSGAASELGYPLSATLNPLPAPGAPAFVIDSVAPYIVGETDAIGFDLGVDPRQRAAFELARDRGEAVITAPIELVPTGILSVVVAAPVYETAEVPRTAPARRRTFTGLVAATVAGDALLAPLRADHVQIRVEDVGATTDPLPPADATGDLLWETNVTGAPIDGLTRVADVNAADRRWRLTLTAVEGFGVAPPFALTVLPLITGGLLSLLLAGMVLLVGRHQMREAADAANLAAQSLTLQGVLDAFDDLHARLSSNGTVLDVHTGGGLTPRPDAAPTSPEESERDAARRALTSLPLTPGSRPWDTFPRPVADRLHDAFGAMWRSGEQQVVDLAWEVDADDPLAPPVRRHLEVRMSIVHGSDVVALGVRDRTSRERVRQELAEARDELSHLNDVLEARVIARTDELEATTRTLERSHGELERFIYAAAHDLRTPLATVFSTLSYVLSENDSLAEEDADLLARAHQASGRMRDLVGELIETARSSTADVEEQVDLADVVADVQQQVGAATESGAPITIDGTLPTVVGAPDTLRIAVRQALLLATTGVPGTLPYEVVVRPEQPGPGVQIVSRFVRTDDPRSGAPRPDAGGRRLHDDTPGASSIGVAALQTYARALGASAWVDHRADEGVLVVHLSFARDGRPGHVRSTVGDRLATGDLAGAAAAALAATPTSPRDGV